MKKNRYIVIFAMLLALQACKSSKNTNTQTKTSDNPTIVSIGGQPVYTSEFSYVYKKNNANAADAYTSESVKDYLKLYINFKLKVREAEEMGLDTASSFKEELRGYKKQLAQPYFTEKSVTEKLTKEAYERMKEEINASHILIKVAPDADAKDTIAAFKKITEIREKAVSGEPFEKLAQQYSEDPSAKTNKGNLGYFTAFGTIYPFETAAYNTSIGSISNPVRTQFGYHILKVNNKRKSQGQVKVAHIMVRATEGISESDSIAAKQKIDEIYIRLKQGEDWNKLVTQFSEDQNSKNKGGELLWFSAGKMIPSFEEASFALQNPKDFSAPVLTPYGWHIIKLLERKQLESFEVLEPTIKSKVSKDRGEVNKKALLERLRKENNFVENTKAVNSSVALADSTLLSGTWSFKGSPNNSIVLFTINKNKYTQDSLFKYVQKRQRARKNISPEQYMRTLYKDYSEESLIAYEEAHLEEKYSDYKMLVKEYRDGILLFQLMDEKVWSKAIEDTSGLKKFFNEHRDKYKWDYRADAKIFNLTNSETLEKLKVELKKEKFPVKDYAAKEIFFVSDKTDNISNEDKKNLEKTIHDMNKNKHLIAEITGSADYSEKNDVAGKRAETIKEYFISQGIDPSRIITLSKKATKSKSDKSLDRKASINMYTNSAKELEKYFNENAPLTVQASEGIFQKGENEILSTVEWKEGAYTTDKEGRIYYIIISKVEAPRLKTFEEARGLAISDYQSYLEKQWIESLTKKYPYSINEAEVQKVIRP